MELNNPLKQYFRRPAVYLRLPSDGIFYNIEVVDMPENRELPVYPMTAIDDITAKTPDALFNGQALVDIIKSCVPNIKNPWKINSIDLDTILVAIRSASNNGVLDVKSPCPSCNTENEYSINLAGIINGIKMPNYNEPLILGDLKILFKPLTYKELNDVNLAQLEIQRLFANLDNIADVDERTKRSSEALKTVTKITIETLVKTIESIELPSGVIVDESNYILEYLRSCDKRSFETVRDYAGKLKQESASKPIRMKCLNCQHEYEQNINLNITDFFE